MLIKQIRVGRNALKFSRKHGKPGQNLFIRKSLLLGVWLHTHFFLKITPSPPKNTAKRMSGEPGKGLPERGFTWCLFW